MYRLTGPILSDRVAWSVTIVNPAKTAEPIEMPFGFWTRVCSRNHGVQIPLRKGNFKGGRGDATFLSNYFDHLLWPPYVIGVHYIFAL